MERGVLGCSPETVLRSLAQPHDILLSEDQPTFTKALDEARSRSIAPCSLHREHCDSSTVSSSFWSLSSHQNTPVSRRKPSILEVANWWGSKRHLEKVTSLPRPRFHSAWSSIVCPQCPPRPVVCTCDAGEAGQEAWFIDAWAAVNGWHRPCGYVSDKPPERQMTLTMTETNQSTTGQ